MTLADNAAAAIGMSPQAIEAVVVGIGVGALFAVARMATELPSVVDPEVVTHGAWRTMYRQAAAVSLCVAFLADEAGAAVLAAMVLVVTVLRRIAPPGLREVLRQIVLVWQLYLPGTLISIAAAVAIAAAVTAVGC